MKKTATKQNLIFTLTPELDFNPYIVAEQNGLPCLKDDFRQMLDVPLTSYRMLDDLENRLSLLQREMDFQTNRITEWSDESATKISPSDLAQAVRDRLQKRYQQEGRSLTYLKLKEFDVPENLLFTERSLEILPSGVYPQNVLEQILAFCQIKELLPKNEAWKKLIFSSLTMTTLFDAYWWLLLELFQKQQEDTTSVQVQLNTSIVSHIRELKENIEQYQRVLFAKKFAELLSKWLYTAFLETFPTHGNLFKNKFKEQVVKCAARWTNTPVIQGRFWRKWDPWLLVSDRAIAILRTTLRGGISGAELLHYDATALDADITRLRKEMSRGGTDSVSGTNTTPPSATPFFLRSSPSYGVSSGLQHSRIMKNVAPKITSTTEIALEE